MENARRSRPAPTPITQPRNDSIRSRRKSISKRSAAGSDDTASEEEDRVKSQLKKSASLRKPDSGSSSRPPSRPQSRAERKRTDSNVSIGTDKEKDKPEKSKRMSVAGWMGSITGRGKKDKLADALMQDSSDSEAEDPKRSKQRRQSNTSRSSPTKHRPSASNTPNASPLIPSRLLKLPMHHNKKVAIAMHDFNAGSSDELSFKAGDQIVVLNEVLDGWWMGELNGRTGLFPTTYTEVVNSSSSSLVPSKPPLPPRAPMPTSGRTSTSPSPPPETSPVDAHPKPPSQWLTDQATGASLEDDDHPFGDHLIAASRSPLRGTFDAESVGGGSSGDEAEEEHRRLVPGRDADADDGYDYHTTPRSSGPPPLPVRRPSVPASKRPPPPPPPRRGSTTLPGMLGAPPIPGRAGVLSNASSQSNSTNASFVSIAPPSPGLGHDGLTSSPFD
jgi:hypothetical protein